MTSRVGADLVCWLVWFARVEAGLPNYMFVWLSEEVGLILAEKLSLHAQPNALSRFIDSASCVAGFGWAGLASMGGSRSPA